MNKYLRGWLKLHFEVLLATYVTTTSGARKHSRWKPTWREKTHRTHDVAFINELIMEHHRITQYPMAITQYDNKACFDLTIPNIANVCNQKFDIPSQICTLVTKKQQTTLSIPKPEYQKVHTSIQKYLLFMGRTRDR